MKCLNEPPYSPVKTLNKHYYNSIKLQINPINKFLTSREYKIMLNNDLFKDRDEGIKKITSIIKSQVESQNGTFTPVIPEEKFKTVWYLDTKNHDLYENKNNGLLIRVKENHSKSEYKVEFKIRNSSKAKAASYDLSNPVKNPIYDFKKKQYKFEEDIKTPFDNIFSVSSVFEYMQEPDLHSYRDIESIYPSIALEIPDKNESLVKVNGFEAIEFNPDIGQIYFPNGKSAEIQLSLWYLPVERSIPCIVEFDIGVEAEKPSNNENDDKFEEFPQSKVLEIDHLYEKLQDKTIGIANLESSKTKTQFVYGDMKQ